MKTHANIFFFLTLKSIGRPAGARDCPTSARGHHFPRQPIAAASRGEMHLKLGLDSVRDNRSDGERSMQHSQRAHTLTATHSHSQVGTQNVSLLSHTHSQLECALSFHLQDHP